MRIKNLNLIYVYINNVNIFYTINQAQLLNN